MLRMVRFFCLARPSASGTQKTSGSVKLRSYAGQAVADVIKQFLFNFWWCNQCNLICFFWCQKNEECNTAYFDSQNNKTTKVPESGASFGIGRSWVGLDLVTSAS